MKTPKRYWAIHGCSTHVAKKYPPPFIDGWEFTTWKEYFLLSAEWKKLREGHILWCPYTRGWSTIKKIGYRRVPIRGLGSPRKMRPRRVVGWYTECHFYLENGYLLYGIDQWQYYYCSGIPPEQREEFFEKLAQFNAQFGKDPLWTGPYFPSVLPSREDWEKIMDEPQ